MPPTATPTDPPGKLAYDFRAAPLHAVFDQSTFSTTYTVTVGATTGYARDLAAGKARLTAVWTGPNCGGTSDLGGHETSPGTWVYTFVWSHPHPPCPVGNHSEVTVGVEIAGIQGDDTCYYRGADTGDGTQCAVH